jgi:hypothetical protein
MSIDRIAGAWGAVDWNQVNKVAQALMPEAAAADVVPQPVDWVDLSKPADPAAEEARVAKLRSQIDQGIYMTGEKLDAVTESLLVMLREERAALQSA